MAHLPSITNMLPDGIARWACVADRVFDGERVISANAVLIDGNRVAGVLPGAHLPQGTPILSAPGCTILPGLIDTHTHFMRWEGPLYLAYGVTTVRDVANPLTWILARRREAASHPWPRLFTTGPALDGPSPHWPELSWSCTDLADGRAKIRDLRQAGVDGIKLYVRLPLEWIHGMVDEAHAAQLPVMMHPPGGGCLPAARAGIDEAFHLDGLLEELWPESPGGWLERWGRDDFPADSERAQQVADEIARLGMIITPTLTVWDFMRLASSRYDYAPEDRDYLPHQLVEGFLPAEAAAATATLWTRALDRARQFLGLLIDREVPITAGTDVPWTFHLPGHMLWREMAFLVESGMTPIQALRAATTTAARALGIADIGRLAPGTCADLVIVDGDPTHRLPPRPAVRHVVRGGQLFQPAAILDSAGSYQKGLAHEPMAQAFQRYFSELR